MYPSFIKANQIESEEKRMLSLKQLLHKLPYNHFETFRHLALHLRKVADHCSINKVRYFFFSLSYPNHYRSHLKYFTTFAIFFFIPTELFHFKLKLSFWCWFYHYHNIWVDLFYSRLHVYNSMTNKRNYQPSKRKKNMVNFFLSCKYLTEYFQVEYLWSFRTTIQVVIFTLRQKRRS